LNTGCSHFCVERSEFYKETGTERTITDLLKCLGRKNGDNSFSDGHRENRRQRETDGFLGPDVVRMYKAYLRSRIFKKVKRFLLAKKGLVIKIIITKNVLTKIILYNIMKIPK